MKIKDSKHRAGTIWRSRSRAVSATLCAALLIAGGAQAAIPADAIAWWRFDPGRFRVAGPDDPGRTHRKVVLAGIRAAVASRVIGDENAAKALQGLLAASEVGRAPHTLCLLDLDAHRPPSGRGMAPDRLRMVLELRTSEGHRSVLRTVRAILTGGDRATPNDGQTPAPSGSQRALELPGGRRGVAYREKDWAEWREVSWASNEKSFIIGFGAGALSQWFAAQGDADEQTPGEKWSGEAIWAPHQRIVEENRPDGDVFFEAYLGVDRLRDGFPEAFVGGRARRVLEELDLSNARDFMLHGRWVEPASGADHAPMIALDATWSARSSPPGTIRRRAISEASWPGEALAMAPPPGSYIIAMRARWAEWTETALRLVPAATPNEGYWKRRRAIRRWRRERGGEMDRFLSRLKPWLVVSDVPPPVLPMPGASTFFAEFRRGAERDKVEAKLRALLEPFADRVGARRGVWSFRVDPNGLIRMPAWGFIETNSALTMVAGWGPPVVSQNRERLGRDDR